MSSHLTGAMCVARLASSHSRPATLFILASFPHPTTQTENSRIPHPRNIKYILVSGRNPPRPTPHHHLLPQIPIGPNPCTHVASDDTSFMDRNLWIVVLIALFCKLTVILICSFSFQTCVFDLHPRFYIHLPPLFNRFNR